MSASLQFGPEWMRKASTRSASNSSSKEQDPTDSSPPPSTSIPSSNNKPSSTIQQRRQPSLSSLNQPNSGPAPVKNPSIRSPGGFSFAAAASAAGGGGITGSNLNLSSPLTSQPLGADSNEADPNQKDPNLRYSRERLLSLYAGGASSPLDHPTPAAADPTSPGSAVNGTSHKKKTPGASERDFSSLRSPTAVELGGGGSAISSGPRSAGGANGERTERERERSGGLFQRPSGGTVSALHSPTNATSHRERFTGIQGGVLSGVGPTPRRKKDGDSEASLSPGLEKGSWIRTNSIPDTSAQLRGKSSDRVNPSVGADAAARPSRFRRDRPTADGPIGPPADGSAGFKSRRERIPSVAGASAEADSWRTSATSAAAAGPASDVNGSSYDGSGNVPNGAHLESDSADVDSALASHATSVLDSLSLDANEEVGLGLAESNGTSSNEGGAQPSPPEWKVEDQSWFYRDPAGNEQGPFPAATMHDWHSQSYFNNELLMRREQESEFLPLGDIIALLGNSSTPFLLPPPAPAPAVPPPSEEPPLPLRDQFQPDIGPFGGQVLPGQAGFNSPFHQVSDLGRNGWSGPGMAPRGWLPNLDLGFGGGSQSPGPASPFGAPQQAYGVSPFGGPRDEYSALQQREAAARGPEFGQLGSDPFGNGQSWDHSGWNAGQSLLHQQPDHLQQHGMQQQPTLFDRFNQQPSQQHTPQLEPQQAWGSPHVGYNQAHNQQTQSSQQQTPWDGIQALRDANQESTNFASNEKAHVTEPIGTPRRARSPAPSSAPSASVAAEEPTPAASEVAEETPAVEAAVEEEKKEAPPVQTPPAEEPAIEQLWPQSPSAVEFASEPTYPTDASSDQRQSSQPQATTNDEFASRGGRRQRRGKKLELDADEKRAGSPIPGSVSGGSIRVVSEDQFRKGSAPASSSSSAQAPLSAWMPESGSGTPTSATAKAAPWAGQTSSSKEEGLSLREIQEAESRRAEAQRALRAAASQRASRGSGSPTTSSSADSLPTNMSWGLASIPSTAPSSKSSLGDATSSSAWSAPSKAPPKKTLMEIQEEERLRAQRAREAQAGLRKAYADSASKQGAPAGISIAPAAAAAGWNVVGAGGKPSTPTTPTATSNGSTTSAAKPSSQQRAVSLGASQTNSNSSGGGAWSIIGSKTNGGPPILPASVPPKPPAQISNKTRAQSSLFNEPSGDAQPSTEFVKYCKEQLKGLNIKVDDFIEMLLSFPLDPSPDVIEIIAESVYANSSTLDGRRFAADFVAKRKLDASGRGIPASSLGRGNAPGFGGSSQRSASEVLKSSNAAKADSGFGFKVVNKKGKKGK